ncbi:MAG: M24 family metallopeptidase [Trueperaceae bacterium]|nr:M24 family metallopeptidase [Trueperaceae bacterium]
MDWLEKAQRSLAKEHLAAWIIYDFCGTNPIAQEYLALNKTMSRRVFCIVPQQGQATLIVHSMDRAFVTMPGMTIRSYSSRQSLEVLLKDLVPKARVALEYSPNSDIPYISYVDGGVIDILENLGAQPVSSAPLLQALNLWSAEQLRAHVRVAEHLNLAKNIAFEYISLHAPMGKSVRESDVQKVIGDYFERHRLSYDPPNVSFGRNTAHPNYVTQLGKDAVLKMGDMIMIDLWAKLALSDAPFANISWAGMYGEPNIQIQKMWNVIKAARNLVVQSLHKAYKEKRCPKGCEMDQIARTYIGQKGYGQAFIHRTGYSLGIKHRQGHTAHLDDFETHDSRPLSPGLGIAIEPGIYLEHFGLRSKINVFLEATGPKVTTEVQEDLFIV